MVSNEAKDAGACEAGCCMQCGKWVWEWHCHCQPALDARHSLLEEGNGEDAKRLIVKEELIKDSDNDIGREIDAQSIGAGGHGHCLGRKSRGQNCARMDAGLVWKPRLRV